MLSIPCTQNPSHTSEWCQEQFSKTIIATVVCPANLEREREREDQSSSSFSWNKTWLAEITAAFLLHWSPQRRHWLPINVLGVLLNSEQSVFSLKHCITLTLAFLSESTRCRNQFSNRCFSASPCFQMDLCCVFLILTATQSALHHRAHSHSHSYGASIYSASLSIIHSHSGGQAINGNLGFSFWTKDTWTRGLEVPGIEPPSFLTVNDPVNDPLQPLSHSRPDVTVQVLPHLLEWP